jgi:hypothetical protein
MRGADRSTALRLCLHEENITQLMLRIEKYMVMNLWNLHLYNEAKAAINAFAVAVYESLRTAT